MSAARDPGVYDGVPSEDYHIEPGDSSTMLRTLLQQSAFHAWAHHINPKRPPYRRRAGQLEGTLCHTATLEPFEFDTRYVVIPADAPRRPTAAQQNARDPSWKSLQACKYWERFDAAAAGREQITAEQRAVAMAQAEAIHCDPEAAEILAAGTPELSAYWVDEATGEPCKVRPDWERPLPGTGAVWLADVKTFTSARPEDVRIQIRRKLYHVQAAFYADGFHAAGGGRVDQFVFIFVEDAYPFAVSVHRLHPEDGEISLAAGRRLYRQALETVAECRRTGRWPAYPGLHTAHLPARRWD